jgi:hypothetical protein
MPPTPVERIAAELVAMVSDDAAHDLRFDQPDLAIERHFRPLKAKALPRSVSFGDTCSTDGWYEVNIDLEQPWIFYSGDQSEGRIRFTIAHELGHHLLASEGSALLDDIDKLAGTCKELIAIEESVCHQFAGAVLIRDSDLSEVIGDQHVLPAHILELYRHGAASLEAIAVRVAGRMSESGAIVIMRNDSTIGFCASSPAFGHSWWGRGSEVRLDGPLARAMTHELQAVPETYRFGLSYAEELYCDTLPVDGKYAIAVLSDRPSIGTRYELAQVEPRWKDEIQFCSWCLSVERDVGWCDACKGRYCRQCDRCGCIPPADNPVCPSCRLRNPRRPGANVCRDCE